MARVLIVDEDPQIRRFLSVSLGTYGHRVVEADSAAEGIRLGQRHEFDLVILEPRLQDMSGQEAITAIRQKSTVPIIVLSACADEANKVEALDRGADDYVVKPFAIGELMARVRALLKHRPAAARSGVVVAGDLHIDLARRHVVRRGKDVHLTKREFDLLKTLALHPDHVLSHQTLLRAVWGPARENALSYLRVYIMQLREKLERVPATPTLIVTEPGIGYRLKTSNGHVSAPPKGDSRE